jgi:uridine kinase
MANIVTIGIAGGSGAGKTTLARRLFEELGGETAVAYIVHDFYYKDLSHRPPVERAKNNFDHPEVRPTYS